MQKRTQRDVISQLSCSQSQYQQQINSKKRKFQEAFDKEKVDLDDSSDSKQSSGRKQRLLNEVKEQCQNVLEYEESIDFMRKTNPDFQEIRIHDLLQEEIKGRPFSWITREIEEQRAQKALQEESKVALQGPKLEIIGEASLEMGSSLANHSSYQNQTKLEEVSDINFKTANNSLEQIQHVPSDLAKIKDKLNHMY